MLALAPSYPTFATGARVRRGVGDTAQAAGQAVSIGGTLGSAGVAVAVPAGLITAGTASLAIPLIGVGVAAVIGAIALWKNSGCGQTCVITGDDANKIEPYLQQNLAGYFAGPRTKASQEAALANFDYFWSYLLQACGQPALGNAGKRCISDRQAGACVWKQTDAGAASYPGVPAAGACWNWFNGYRDPIANDTGVVQGSPTLNDVVSQATGVQSSIPLLGGIDLTESFDTGCFTAGDLVGVMILRRGMSAFVPAGAPYFARQAPLVPTIINTIAGRAFEGGKYGVTRNVLGTNPVLRGSRMRRRGMGDVTYCSNNPPSGSQAAYLAANGIAYSIVDCGGTATPQGTNLGNQPITTIANPNTAPLVAPVYQAPTGIEDCVAMGLATSAGQACVARNTARRGRGGKRAHCEQPAIPDAAVHRERRRRMGSGRARRRLLVCRAIWRVCYIGVRTDCFLRSQRDSGNFCVRCCGCAGGGRGAAEFPEFNRLQFFATGGR